MGKTERDEAAESLRASISRVKRLERITVDLRTLSDEVTNSELVEDYDHPMAKHWKELVEELRDVCEEMPPSLHESRRRGRP